MTNVFVRFGQSLLLAMTLCAGAWIVTDVAASANPGAGYRTREASAPILYRHYCSVCHGEQGNGQSRATASLSPPPTDFTNASATLTRERMIASVRDGRSGTAMVGWKTQLSESQIATLVDYVRQQFVARAGAPAVRTLTPAAQVRPTRQNGDFDNGQKLYAAHCVACHGRNGEGTGVVARLQVQRDKITDTRAGLIHAIALGKPGTAMAPWNKVLTHQEITDVAEWMVQHMAAGGATPRGHPR